jgi:predicted glycoside hydrolase/deacetylase ChbG (UPF0249 family)
MKSVFLFLNNFRKDLYMNFRIVMFLVIMAFLTPAANAQQEIRLIVRADDMGYHNDINYAIIKAHKEGIVTSASIMPASLFFDEGVKMCKEYPELAAGIHLAVMGTGFRPVLSPEEVPTLVDARGCFFDTREELDKANPDPADYEKEIRAQVDKAIRSGLRFIYMDYHMNPPEIVADIVRKVCLEQKMIYGQNTSGSQNGYTWVYNDFESWPLQTLPDGAIAYYDIVPMPAEKKQMFYDLLENLKPGTLILAVHPGLVGKERSEVTAMLCSLKAKEIIKNKHIRLISYADILK